MKKTTSGDRILALSAGVTFTGGALYILLEDVFKHHLWTMEHALTVLTVFGTIAVGHLAVDAARRRHILAAIGFCLLFVAGTALTVYNSVGRQAETSDARLLDAEARNEQIIAAKRALATNAAMLAEARTRHARECASGRGKRCDGIAATIRVYEDAVKGNEADLAKLGPPVPVAPKAEKMATVAAIFGADKTQAKAFLMLIEPFAYTLFFELGSIISLGYGLSGNQAKETSSQFPARAGRLPETHALQLHNGSVASRNQGNLLNRCRETISKSAAEHELIARLATGATVAAQDDLAAEWNVNKGTVSKWVTDWERNGKIPARQQIGRCKMIARVDT